MKLAPSPDLTAAARLIAELRARGIRLESHAPGRLRIGPPEMVDAETMERARRAKPELVRILTTARTWPCTRCGRFRFHLPTCCYWCRRADAHPAHA